MLCNALLIWSLNQTLRNDKVQKECKGPQISIIIDVDPGIDFGYTSNLSITISPTFCFENFKHFDEDLASQIIWIMFICRLS